MMMTFTFAASIALLTWAATPRAEDRLAADVTALVRPRIDDESSVGIVVGVLRSEKSAVFGFDRPSWDDDEVPDGRTIFEIGSITKVFTSIALAEMAKAKLVSLDQPVRDLLPEGVRVPDRQGRAILLRDLSGHRSGLPAIPPKVALRSIVGLDPYAGVTPEDVYRFLKVHDLKRDPGEGFEYSNLGAGLLGLALARKSNSSYEAMITSRISSPLGMDDTRIMVNPTRALRLAKPHTSDGGPSIPWTFDALAGAGALRSTADDLLRFAKANLGIVATPPSLREALDEARRPRTATDHEHVRLGLGWFVNRATETPKRPELTWHAGGTGGFRSFLGLVVAERAAFVVLSNSDASVDTLGIAVLDRLLID